MTSWRHRGPQSRAKAKGVAAGLERWQYRLIAAERLRVAGLFLDRGAHASAREQLQVAKRFAAAGMYGLSKAREIYP